MASVTVPPSTFLGSTELNRSSFVPRQTQGFTVAGAPPSISHRASRLTVEARKRRSLAEKFGRQQQPMPAPKMDSGDDSPKFVIFVKTKNVSIWYPLSMVSGGTTAQMMVNLMKWDLGKKLYGGTLTRNMASVVYKDERAIQQAAIKQYPMLKGASGFEYGYKMVDKDNPKASVSGSGVIKIPPEEEMKTVVDKAKDLFGGGLASLKQNFSGSGSESAQK